jgi:predicted RNA binding protein YcfA (HicA-like mRNA interferase family)
VSRLPDISGDECVSALMHPGYSIIRIKGDYIRLRCTGRTPVIVPKHDTLDRGILKSILRTVDITIDKFHELLKQETYPNTAI